MVRDIHAMSRMCTNCYNWAINKKHEKSDRFTGSVCLERVAEGYTYTTSATESCSRFKRITVERVKMTTADIFTSKKDLEKE
jgi:hypothetical protein